MWLYGCWLSLRVYERGSPPLFSLRKLKARIVTCSRPPRESLVASRQVAFITSFSWPPPIAIHCALGLGPHVFEAGTTLQESKLEEIRLFKLIYPSYRDKSFFANAASDLCQDHPLLNVLPTPGA